ncbi:putative quinol monooxygenase [Roseomonas fluvialis]|uniref:Antibiotic biosynthesis monooxygenase n=1 Tax=Roseomonas fluvialis TaxID=1750527 RepID=A0ABN6NY19_9PROT|nr:putative quinol monooxygenase [Roseomonas fluvialis]BDG71312.1 antibiotic biosynthesis monooxygenase [Roseomonas fluvialis]
MAVTYTILFRVRAGQIERFHALLGGVLDAMRGEDGFISATLLADPQDANRVLLHETWRDHDEVVAVEVNRPYRDAWHAALPELLEAPREIGMWTPLRDDRRG